MRNNQTKTRRALILTTAVVFTSLALTGAPIALGVDGKKISRQIPEASLHCSPEVKAWWDALRDAGDRVMRSRGSNKDRKRFAELLQEGATKNYAPPIPDHKPIPLVQTPPEYTEEARQNHINARIGLSIEVLADGTIGQVTPLNNLGYGLDESAVAAAQKAVFLPAVQNGVFATYTMRVEMSFSIH
ncbi:MAG TPA: energy transducer TonB [Pyrinomonadaceae bacterium]